MPFEVRKALLPLACKPVRESHLWHCVQRKVAIGGPVANMAIAAASATRYSSDGIPNDATGRTQRLWPLSEFVPGLVASSW